MMLNRVSLNTIGLNRIGLNRIGKPSRGSSDRPYIDPEVLASLKAVCICYGKSNDDPDRAIVKNLVDPDNPFVISNAAFKLNSGFGLYAADFLDWTSSKDVQKTSFEVKITSSNYKENWVAYKAPNTTFKAMKVRISGIPDGGALQFFRTTADGGGIKMVNGINEIPAFTNTVAAGFYIDIPLGFDWSNLVIEQIPSFEGAFVTDGVNDTIISTKTLAEMGITDEVTVVSMIHQIALNSTFNNGFTNYIENLDKSSYVRNNIYNTGKTGIYGYSASLINRTASNINDILGDKKDYGVEIINRQNTLNSTKFSVIGRASSITEVSSVAWYWTIIANKGLTTDQINQVIAYFNLDRTLKSDIYCNIAKQGITNENHAEFGDKLIDFSGNGRDIQLNNIAWKGDSGIGKYETELSNTSIWTQSKETTSSPFSSSYNGLSGWIIFANTELTNSVDMPSFKIQVKGLLEGQELIYRYYDSNGQSNVYSITKDGDYTLPSDFRTAKPQISNTSGFQVVKNEANIITITQIPSHAGGLCLDGVNDFGKVTGMPIYKDYTVVTDREIFANIGAISSKNNPGAFLETAGNSVYSFGQVTSGLNFISTRSISYLSKYSYCGQSITAGAAEDGTDMWLGTIRDNDTRFFNGAIYSLMSFPYSMSEFLIERQLKKHKLGTLYPDMVEFRPIVKSNVNWDTIEIWQGDKSLYRPAVNDDKTGIYLKKNSTIGIYVKPNVGQKVSEIVCNGVSYTDLKINSNGFYYKVVPITKSPQKINVAIEQDENYVKFEPVITSNVEYVRLDFYLNNYQKRINIGDYIPKDAYLRANFYLKNNVDELTVFTFNGVNIGYRRSSVDDTAFNINQIYNYDSPQEVNITIDEYIRYEDIVQPYPVLLRFNDENGNEVSWGGKFRVGSTITRIGSAADSNLLPNIYNILGLLLNGNQVTSSKVIVEKTMVFKAKSAYIFDNNEPKCILSPRLLRIPNSSYKILGYIPDISGHGNHGVIHNSAYEGASGANGESGWRDLLFYDVDKLLTEEEGFKVTSNTISVTKNGLLEVDLYPGDIIPSGKVIVTGLKEGSYIKLDGDYGSYRIEANGYHDIPTSGWDNMSGYIYFNNCEGVIIEGIGEYEGAFCLDGVDDFIDIPTLSSGGKQVLMKVNWHGADDEVLYDQRNSNIQGNYNLAISTYPDTIAYNFRNEGGKTFIDGILNHYIVTNNLKSITHNITSINGYNNDIDSTVRIGRSVFSRAFSKTALYDFMLFDDISTDDKIKELNEYVGIEAKVELPPYYWDNYGKTNLDEDKNYTANLGTVKDVIETGYPYTFVDADAWWGSDVHYTVIDNYTARLTPSFSGGSSELYFSYRGNIPLKVKITSTETYSLLYHASEDIRFNVIANEPLITELPYGTFEIIGLGNDSYITIELLPTEINTLYGLSNTNFAYDKMSGFGGYPFSKFTDIGNKWQYIEQNSGIEFVSLSAYSYTAKRIGDNTWYYSNIETKYITKDILINVRCSKSIEIKWELKYKTNDNPDSYSTKALLTGIIGQDAKVVTLRHVTDEELETLGAIKDSIYYLLYFDSRVLPIGEEYTIEMLPLYPNGLVYDGVTDYSENANIPALTDYTYIFKREFLSKTTGSASMYKGEFFANGGMAFIADYAISDGSLYGFSYRGQAKVNSLNTDKIIYGTKTSVNGSSITPNTNIDTAGLTMGKFDSYRKMVFYKLILYPKTIPLLQINFLKNLMEKDEIIDLTNPIFIQE